MDPKGNEKFAIFMFFFNLKCWYIYIYLYMFREDLYLFLFVHFLVGQNVGIPFQILTDAEKTGLKTPR